jgi:hypothetical protein
MSHKNCITHSFACDCREEQFRLLKEKNKELESLVEKLDEIRKFAAKDTYEANPWTIVATDVAKKASALEQDKAYQEYINSRESE